MDYKSFELHKEKCFLGSKEKQKSSEKDDSFDIPKELRLFWEFIKMKDFNLNYLFISNENRSLENFIPTILVNYSNFPYKLKEIFASLLSNELYSQTCQNLGDISLKPEFFDIFDQYPLETHI